MLFYQGWTFTCYVCTSSRVSIIALTFLKMKHRFRAITFQLDESIISLGHTCYTGSTTSVETSVQCHSFYMGDTTSATR